MAQFKFPFFSILWSFFYHVIKFTVSLISLSSVHLFVCFLNNLNYCCQQMPGAYKMCTVIRDISCNQFYESRVLLEHMIAVSESAQ